MNPLPYATPPPRRRLTSGLRVLAAIVGAAGLALAILAYGQHRADMAAYESLEAASRAMAATRARLASRPATRPTTTPGDGREGSAP